MPGYRDDRSPRSRSRRPGDDARRRCPGRRRAARSPAGPRLVPRRRRPRPAVPARRGKPGTPGGLRAARPPSGFQALLSPQHRGAGPRGCLRRPTAAGPHARARRAGARCPSRTSSPSPLPCSALPVRPPVPGDGREQKATGTPVQFTHILLHMAEPGGLAWPYTVVRRLRPADRGRCARTR
jgi:hypothetical protein